MGKEQILNIIIVPVPDIHVRVIDDSDTEPTKKSKIKYPFELKELITVTIITNIRKFSFNIYKGYTWNGADVPRFLWRLIGSRTSNEFLVASMLHDFLLEFKGFLIKEVLHNAISIDEYRRLTSLIFREKLKAQGTNTIKANIMSWCVDVYQHYGNKRGWKIK